MSWLAGIAKRFFGVSPKIEITPSPTLIPLRTIADVDRLIAEAGFGERAAVIRKRARPSFRIYAGTGGVNEIGVSRFGGLPDLPPGTAWPQASNAALPFLAQINLADLERKEGIDELSI